MLSLEKEEAQTVRKNLHEGGSILYSEREIHGIVVEHIPCVDRFRFDLRHREGERFITSRDHFMGGWGQWSKLEATIVFESRVLCAIESS